MGRIPDATRIFEFNTKEYPRSSNAFVSLADAYLCSGNLERGRKNLEKALELDPQNRRAAETLRKMDKK